ncbi:hypothetical protein [Desulfocucumis palustris]|nr:hypothetical protein [Desulfocucumis palustris]
MSVNAVKKPIFVGELVVYMDTPEEARVIEIDCRYELNTTANSCTCCTYRFGSRRDPKFQCRHMAAVRKVMNGEVTVESE